MFFSPTPLFLETLLWSNVAGGIAGSGVFSMAEERKLTRVPSPKVSEETEEYSLS